MDGKAAWKRNVLVAVAGVAGMAVVLALALPSLLHLAGLHPEYHGATYELPGARALVVTTSHGLLNAPGEEGGEATGVAASELTHPYYAFLDAGMEVDVASVRGGAIPIDPQTLAYPVRSPGDKRLLQDPLLQELAENSLPIAEVDFTRYDAVFLSGGWGAAYDLGQSELLGVKVGQAYAAGTPILGAVCHGVLGFINARDANGDLLIAGRRMTGVTDKQVRELGIEVTPLHPEAELRKAGVVFESRSAFRDVFATHVVVDDEQRFVTGQNQNSGLATAHAMMALIATRDAGRDAP